jgi:hypothetical protein
MQVTWYCQDKTMMRSMYDYGGETWNADINLVTQEENTEISLG